MGSLIYVNEIIPRRNGRYQSVESIEMLPERLIGIPEIQLEKKLAIDNIREF